MGASLNASAHDSKPFTALEQVVHRPWRRLRGIGERVQIFDSGEASLARPSAGSSYMSSIVRSSV